MNGYPTRVLPSLALDMDALAYFTRHQFLIRHLGLEGPDVYVRMNAAMSSSVV